MNWRTGRKAGRTIYDDADQLIGVMDTPALAYAVVQAINTLHGDNDRLVFGDPPPWSSAHADIRRTRIRLKKKKP